MDSKYNSQMKFLVNIAYYLAIAALVYVFFAHVFGLLTPFVLAFCLVSVVHPIIRKITSLLKINQKIIAILVVALIYGMFGMFIFWLAMQVILFVRETLSTLPDFYYETLAPAVIKVSNWAAELMADFPVEYKAELKSVQGDILKSLQTFVLSLSEKGISLITGITNKIPSFFIALLFTIMLSFFISIQYESVIRFIKRQLSPNAAKFVSDFRTIFANTIFKYLRAYLILMSLTFSELSLGLSLLRVENPLVMAAIIAVFDILPVLGAGGILTPWALWSIFNGNYSLGIGLFMLYGCIYIVRNIVEPKVVGDQLGLNPIVSITVMYMGFRLFGFAGMILMPITAQIILSLHKNGNIQVYK